MKNVRSIRYSRWNPRLRLPIAAALSLALVGLLLAVTVQQSDAATAVVFKPTADAYVRSDQPDTNFGTKYVLSAQAGSASTPSQASYVQFTVSGLGPGTPASVQLFLYTYATSSTGLQVWTAPSTWTESGITYATAPPLSQTMVGAIPTITTNAWASLDVSPVVTGNGTYTFAITTTSTANKQMASREATATPPQLSVQTGSQPASVSASSGSGQSADPGTAFGQPLQAVVRDGSGAGVPNAQVTFTAPGSGPSGTFPGGTAAVSVTTDGNGVATAPTVTANGLSGTYSVTAAVAGTASPATFQLTNNGAAPTSSIPATSSATGTTSATPTSSPPATSSAATSGPATTTPATSASSTSATTTTTFLAGADAYVRSDQPDVNFGSKYNLAAEAGSASTPTITSYLTFPVTKLTGTVVSATLQVYSYATSSQGIVVHTSATDWSEPAITYTTAPAVGPTVGNGPNIVLNTWASVDLGSAVSGNGTYGFSVTTTRTSNNQLGSRESGTPPKLVVVTVPAATSTAPTTSTAPVTSTAPATTDSGSATSATPTDTTTSTSTSTSTTTTAAVQLTASGGAVQSAMVGSMFAAPLMATARDPGGQPIPGVAVTFNAPGAGASATFPGGAATVTVTTDASGNATTPPVTANATAGSYPVTASADGAQQSATFTMTNSDPTIVAAGDIACGQGTTVSATACQQTATSDLALSLHPDAVLALGDNQYELGAQSDFESLYSPSWGRLKDITYPVPGNHEYGYIGTAINPTGGTGYFTYFGDRSHPRQPGCTTSCLSYYSYNLGSWHVVALDSQCSVIGGCNPGNPEYAWLQADLKANTARCTLAYWHIPLYSSSQDHQPDMQAIYSLLYTKGADLVLTGHAHFYERFGPQDGAGNADPVNGIPEFVVGTGGRSFFPIRTTPSPSSEARIANTFGVLQMTLSGGAYSWRFVGTNGSTATDSGVGSCH